MSTKTITIVIVDDEKNSISKLADELKTFRMVGQIRTTTDPFQAKTLIRETHPDLVFLDVEMPGKNGFEVLQDLRHESWFHAHVIFYTAYEKYVLQALRTAAFDCLIKPVQYAELSNLINRYLEEQHEPHETQEKIKRLLPGEDRPIFLPSATGLRFVYRDEIVYCARENKLLGRSGWFAHLFDKSTERLHKNTSAKQLIEQLGERDFVLVNSSTVLNLKYLNVIEFSTKRCLLIPPFQNEEIILSRNCFADLKERFATI